MSKKTEIRYDIFAAEYCIDMNATRAAKAAGSTAKSLKQAGYELLENPEVQKLIREKMAQRAKRCEITQDKVLRELARIAFADLAMAFNEKGELLSPQKMPKAFRRALASIQVDAITMGGCKIGETTKLKTNDKVRALQLLGLHLKMFTQKHELTGTLTLADLVAGSMEDDKK